MTALLNKISGLIFSIVKPKNNNNSTRSLLEQINFNALLFTGFLFSTIFFIFSLLELSDLASNLLTLIFIFLFACFYYLSRFKGYQNLWITSIIIFASLSVTWFIYGGSVGSTPFLYILFLFVVVIIAKEKQQLKIFLTTLTNLSLLYIIEYFFGDKYINHFTGEKYYNDMIFTFLLVLVAAYFFTRFFKRMYENERQKVIEQKKIIETQNEEHLSSLAYASSLQKNMMSHEIQLSYLFKDYFVYFQPKDIVSGDFYWIKQKAEVGVIVIGDCTGHGVPAAFLSILGVSLLEDTFEQMSQEFTASEFLEKLRIKFLTQLRKNTKINEKTNDGMDLGICIIDYKESIIQFSGANRNLLMVRNNEYDIDSTNSNFFEKESSETHTLYTYNSTRNCIGFNYFEQNFINHIISFYPDDTLYLFSDGYGDQFDLRDKKKFKSSQLKKELLKIQNMTMFEQKAHLNNIHNSWKGDTPQTDDILVAGLRI